MRCAAGCTVTAFATAAMTASPPKGAVQRAHRVVGAAEQDEYYNGQLHQEPNVLARPPSLVSLYSEGRS